MHPFAFSDKNETSSALPILERSTNNFKINKDMKLDLNASLSNKSNVNDMLMSSSDNEPDADPTSFLNHPKYAQYFKKRICVRFVPDPKTNLCCGCQHRMNEGNHKYTGTEWNYRTCTTLMPTDAYGKLTFPGSHSKTASYIRVQNETKTKEMIQYLYSPEGWNLQRPQLILSVTGGAQKFTIPHRMKKAFKRGLIKAAASTGAWIITGGTNTGVMRLVGEAVADEFHTCSLTVLGIATWGKIGFRDQMVKKSHKNLQTSLNLDDINKEAQQIRESGTIYKKIIFNDKKKRMKKMILKNLQLENRLMFQVPLFYAQQEIEKKDQSKSNTDVLLDPNHTHFVFVDDGSEGQFGKEIEFRAHLEAELRKGKSLKYYENKGAQKKKTSARAPATFSPMSAGGGGGGGGGGGSGCGGGGGGGPGAGAAVGGCNGGAGINSDEDSDDEDDSSSRAESVPMILIVVQGGPNTLITVEESLKQTVPVLVLADSKGCADLIANACSTVKPDASQLEKLIIESKMFESIKDPVTYQKKVSEAIEKLKYIISKLSDNLINVFRLDSEEGGSDIELTILRAFLNSRKNKYYENLKLALQWNRCDIAKTDIFTGEEEFKSYQLAHLMEMALIQNKPEFIELLLENGLNLKSFLTVRRLCFLYNSHKIHSDAKKAPIFQLYKKKYSADNSSSIITFKGLLKFLKEYLFEDFDPTFLPTDLDATQMKIFLNAANKKESSDVDPKDATLELNFGKNEVIYPEQNLFIWALLLNRIDISILFWQIGEHQICSALFASKLLRSMSTRLSDMEKELRKCASDFEEMAIGVLNIFDSTTDDIINGVILLRKIPYYNLDCLQMAVEADCQLFVSLSSVQNLLTDIWYGKIVSKSGVKAGIRFAISCISLGLMAPFLVFDRREKLTNLSDRENTLKKLATYNKKKNITNLLKGYLTNYEINMDKKEATLLPNVCCKDDSSSSSESSDESTDSDEPPRSMRVDSSVGHLDYAGGNHSLSSRAKKLQKRQDKKKQSKWSTYWSRYKRFVHSPRVHFVYDAFFYFIFLILFSYMILCEFEYYEEVDELDVSTGSDAASSDSLASLLFNETASASAHANNLSIAVTMSTTKMPTTLSTAADAISYVQEPETSARLKVIKTPSWIEYLLIYWMFAFMMEEVRQYFFGDAETKVLKNKLLHYFENNWNYLDISGCLVFSIGMSLRFISMSSSENLFISARIILCIDLCIWYLRLLHVSVVFKSLGPKLVMIQKMVRDLMFFIAIIAIFVSVFGVTTQATLHPGNKLSLSLLKSMLNKAYWPIYGEMKILEELEACNKEGGLQCEFSGMAFSFIALMIYMVIANVLLINLLIAMFSSTFQDVQENTDQIWKFQRYRLVFEYYDSPILPPPLNFIAYLISLTKYLQNKKLQLNKSIEGGDSDDMETDAKDDVDLLLDRERKFAEEYVRMGKFRLKESTDSRLKLNVEKLETLEQKLNEVIETRFKESNQLSVAINWIMSEMDQSRLKAPFIQNIKSSRKAK